MFSEIRSLFPCTRELAFLNTATYGPIPTPVRNAVDRSLDELSSGRGDWLEWERSADEARRLFAELLRVPSACITLLPTVSAAAAQVAASLPDPAGGRSVVVVGEGEFRSNLYPWLEMESRGFEIRVLPFPGGRPAIEQLDALVDDRTAIVALSNVQSSNGHRLPLAPVVAACRKHGARLYLDATQAVGALDLDVTGVDHVAVAGYKWLFAPRGTAFLYTAESHLGAMRPIAPGWKTPEDPYAGYYGLPYDRAAGGSGLDYALPWHSWVGAAEGLRLVHRVGVAAIEAHALALASRFRAGLEPLGLRALFAPEESSHILGLKVSDAETVQSALDARDVVAAVRDGYLRVSFAMFNDDSDVDRALEALGRAGSLSAGRA